MAMELKFLLNDAHGRTITSMAFNPFRREIYTGAEDATIRVWEGDSAKLLATLTEHRGWISHLFYCKELKVLFSCSIDGTLLAWGANNKLLQRIETKTPVYTLNYNPRRQQLLAGFHSKVRVFQVINNDDPLAMQVPPGATGPSVSGNAGAVTGATGAGVGGTNSLASDMILDPRSVSSSEHTDVVKCLVSGESRFYSAGYDRKLVIYDSPHHGDNKLRILSVIANAHDAAISCMTYGKDADNSWIITGGFDRVVKLWSLDGNCLQRFDGFSDTITSFCYVLPTQTLWITASSVIPIVYDPRSGINVSDFVNTDDAAFHQTRTSLRFKNLLFVPENNEVIAVTTRKSIAVWKFNPFASLTTLQGLEDVVETLTFTSKEPLLIFSGGGDGHIRKWERLQLNTFMYSQEILPMPKEEYASEQKESHRKFQRDPEARRRQQVELRRRVSARLNQWRKYTITDGDSAVADGASSSKVALMNRQSIAAFRHNQRKLEEDAKKQGLDFDAANGKTGGEKKQIKPAVIKCVYYEPLDLLFSSYEDAKIYVWGYNEEAFKNVPNAAVDDADAAAAAAANAASGDGNKDGVSNRVAGLTCKYQLHDHRDAVTGLVGVSHHDKHYLLSTGWDRRICIWDLHTGQLVDVFRNKENTLGREELAADGLVLDLDYCAERDEFGYASADKCAYIRRFSLDGLSMRLVAVLQGHESDVTQIKWNPKHKQWITGSDDRSVRIWPADGMPCLRAINNDGPVTALCIDQSNGSVITGSHDRIMRVFDLDKKDELVQKNVGHKDAIKSIIHIPSRNQYLTASCDQTIRIWHAYMKKGQRRLVAKVHVGEAGIQPVQEADEEAEPSFSDLNPLIMPKLLTKTFAKELYQEMKTHEDEVEDQARNVSLLEHELRTTLNDLELALNINEKQAANKKTKRVAKAIDHHA